MKTYIKGDCLFGKIVNMSMKEIADFKKEAHKTAKKTLEAMPKHITHIVYYSDKRNDDGSIKEVSLYPDMVPMDDRTFYERTSKYCGLIGACHRM